VSKIEFLWVRPLLFDDEEATAALVLEALRAGELEGMLRESVEADLRPAAAFSNQAPAMAGWWVRSVLAKLEGRPADDIPSQRYQLCRCAFPLPLNAWCTLLNPGQSRRRCVFTSLQLLTTRHLPDM